MKSLSVAVLLFLAGGAFAEDVRQAAMDVLPLGSVRPEGFLRERLTMQRAWSRWRLSLTMRR